MPRSYPPDVLIFDTDGVLHVRVSRGQKRALIQTSKAYRLPVSTFVPAVVTPELANEAALGETLRRMKMETGRWDKASVLLPDSWFRINIIDLQALPAAREEAEQVIRWNLKRTLPIDVESLRVAFEQVAHSHGSVKVLAVSAVETSLAAIERTCAAAGIEVILIEPVGLNLWNAITAGEAQTNRDRLFFYVRENDFTTAAFRGAQPLFIRSRNLNSDRTIEQEIRLSASYLRDTLRTETVEQCYLAGNRVDTGLATIINAEFQAPVTTLDFRDYAGDPSTGTGYATELAAATGVFTS
jgi:Tfp pilus assembly PilM family ATPase